MEIRKEEFRKLNQLDRIEYLLERKNLEEERVHYFDYSTLYVWFGIVGFYILLAVGMYNIDPEITLSLLSSGRTILGCIVIAGIALLILETLELISHKKRLEELNGRFFYIDISPKENRESNINKKKGVMK